ncbi:aspartate dehydrogenase [Bacillus haikouensis]|jgi:aspartate dehydrogenase|uniref:aspartate dehydrogenase n=1 Tax=Bacillus haikouensis TaxID=1510468 RepID=UPI001554D9A2|nr:aspartate dehydrogenase [Bacillus haikouensis]NQD67098.1 aspartate dehydrogenase [Bacillus haikouensis]
MKLGLIGCGNIGEFLLQAINIDGLLPGGKIVSIYGRREEVASEIAEKYGAQPYHDVDSLLHSNVDLVIEAATIEAAKEHSLKVLEGGKDLLLSSIGVMVDATFEASVREICQKNNVAVFLPSGAIGGLDVLKSAKALNELDSVSITTRKPPSALQANARLKKETVLFEGSAAEAIKQFPRNINVAIVLSLAGLGSEKTKVKIIADPDVVKNSHFIEASGSFGKLKLEVENDPMPSNPKTSYLAALSVLATLQNKDETVQVG